VTVTQGLWCALQCAQVWSAALRNLDLDVVATHKRMIQELKVECNTTAPDLMEPAPPNLSRSLSPDSKRARVLATAAPPCVSVSFRDDSLVAPSESTRDFLSLQKVAAGLLSSVGLATAPFTIWADGRLLPVHLELLWQIWCLLDLASHLAMCLQSTGQVTRALEFVWGIF